MIVFWWREALKPPLWGFRRERVKYCIQYIYIYEAVVVITVKRCSLRCHPGCTSSSGMISRKWGGCVSSQWRRLRVDSPLCSQWTRSSSCSSCQLPPECFSCSSPSCIRSSIFSFGERRAPAVKQGHTVSLLL